MKGGDKKLGKRLAKRRKRLEEGKGEDEKLRRKMWRKVREGREKRGGKSEG